MMSFGTYVFILDKSLIQFGCLLLVCPLLCCFLLFVVVYLVLPDKNTASKLLVCNFLIVCHLLVSTFSKLFSHVST